MEPNADVINYKIYMCAPGYEPEIRRIAIDKDISGNYFYLKQKLLNIFPILANIQFTVSWKDEEGDMVRICSDEELSIALKEMNSHYFKKLFITGSPQEGNEGPVHSNVSCDCCGNTIHGFRYKCINCFNFDLCADCERSQKHPEHPVLRIPFPLPSGQPYHRRFGRDLHKMSKRFEKLQGGAKKEKCENSGKDGVPKRGGRRQTDPWELVSEHLNMFCDFIQGLSPDTAASGWAEFPTAEDTVNGTDREKQFCGTSSNPRRKCEMFAEKLSSFVDPLGGGVNAKEKEKCVPQASSSQSEQQSSSVTEPQSSALQEEPYVASSPQPDTPSECQNHRPAAPQMGDSKICNQRQLVTEINIQSNTDNRGIPNGSPDIDDTWAVIMTNDSKVQIEDARPATGSSAMETEEGGSSNIYPAIPVKPITASGENCIDVTIARLRELGYEDKDGWLREIVEEIGGSLEGVLEFLAPKL